MTLIKKDDETENQYRSRQESLERFDKEWRTQKEYDEYRERMRDLEEKAYTQQK
jgi:hypothetical protein